MTNTAQTLTVDTSELDVLEQQILKADTAIKIQRQELWQLEQNLHALLGTYNKTREKLQKAVWAAQGLKVCPDCGKLKPLDSFKYLFLEHAVTQQGHYNCKGKRAGDCKLIGPAKKFIKTFCTDCYEQMLYPPWHITYCRRLPVEKRGEEFLIDWDGKIRSLKEIFCEEERATISIAEEARFLPAFTIGKSWELQTIGGNIMGAAPR